MKKRTLIILIILIAVAAGLFYFFHSRDKAEPISFATAKAAYGYIGESVTATGTLEPIDTVSVGAQVSGKVQKVYVDYNSVVKKGQLLALVDPSILESQNQESRANLLNAKSNLTLQQSTYNRQSQLYSLGAISKADYEVALNGVSDARAAVANATAQLNVSGRTLSYTRIYSPVNGTVLNRNISEGQTIASSFNAPVLFVIAKDLTKMQVNSAVDEADIGNVKIGEHATFTVDAYPNDLFKGIVKEIRLEPTVSANVVTYTTLIDIDNTDMKLKPGMTASINIFTREDSNALLIPMRATAFKPDSSVSKQYILVPFPKEGNLQQENRMGQSNQKNTTTDGTSTEDQTQISMVWIQEGDTLAEKKILTGLSDGLNVKVLNGLVPGEELITNVIMGSKKNMDGPQASPFLPHRSQKKPPVKPGN